MKPSILAIIVLAMCVAVGVGLGIASYVTGNVACKYGGALIFGMSSLGLIGFVVSQIVSRRN